MCANFRGSTIFTSKTGCGDIGHLAVYTHWLPFGKTNPIMLLGMAAKPRVRAVEQSRLWWVDDHSNAFRKPMRRNGDSHHIVLPSQADRTFARRTAAT